MLQRNVTEDSDGELQTKSDKATPACPFPGIYADYCTRPDGQTLEGDTVCFNAWSFVSHAQPIFSSQDLLTIRRLPVVEVDGCRKIVPMTPVTIYRDVFVTRTRGPQCAMLRVAMRTKQKSRHAPHLRS